MRLFIKCNQFIADTVREMEEVSCSDEEPEVIEVPKKIAPNTSHTTATKKKVSPPAGKKQGSILSFFGKKWINSSEKPSHGIAVDIELH